MYAEAEETSRIGRYADCDPLKQAEFYRRVVQHPPNWGLMASGAFTVRNNVNVERWGDHWWQDCINWTYQDQLSLPVVTRLMTMRGELTWNTNMPWARWWGIANHDR